MKLCPACSRYLRRDATTCPFCQANLASAPSRLAALSLATGLALAGCNGDDGESTTGESTTDVQTATAYGGPPSTSEDPTATTAGESTSTSTSTSSVSDTGMSGPVSAYGGPPADTITDGRGAYLAPPDADAPASPPAKDEG